MLAILWLSQLLLLEVISKTVFEQNDDAAQLGESEIVLSILLVAHRQALAVLQPREEPFDLPTPPVVAQFATILGTWPVQLATLGCDHVDPLLRQLLVQGSLSYLSPIMRVESWPAKSASSILHTNVTSCGEALSVHMARGRPARSATA